jgi:hypothetical protein
MTHQSTIRTAVWRVLAPLVGAVVVGSLAATALARTNAAPQNTAPPSISGTAREGSILTASNGTWSNSPTSFTYQWQRCATDGTACGDITSGTDKTYTLTTGDASHTVRVIVTAVNADGKTAATSDPTDVVASKNGPTNSVKPTVSGTAVVGEDLSSTNGSWSPTPTSFTRQWQRCDTDGSACRNIAGATGRTYTVHTADVDHRLRVLVAAHTSGGGVAFALSNPTAVVASNTSTTTNTTTVTVPGNKAPTIVFISLKRIGVKVFARFRVCDDHTGRITIIERDNKARALAFQRRFGVVLSASCNTFSRSWIPAARFRTHGRFVVTLRAVDKSGALSRLVSRSIVF